MLDLLFGIPDAAAISTSTVITSVGTGMEAGGDAAFDMLGENIDIALIIFGVVLGIGLLMKLTKRGAR